jgi:osmoprotectant transport system ATP-binding protein
MIVADNISKRFNGIKAVDKISFEVKEGETLVLLGTSGCGKTTTLRMLNRLIEPDEGDVLINGENILSQSITELRRNMGYVLQHHGLFPHYTVSENIGIVPHLLHWEKEKTMQRTIVLMEKLQLPAALINAYPSELSGGQAQRVGLARALAANPRILLMDEPFGALDPITRVEIRKELKQLDELKKKTIVLVTHDVQEAFELGDIICLMKNGSIEQIGEPAALLYKPATAFVSQFLEQERLQLILKSVLIKNVWNLLVPSQGAITNHLTIDNNLWEAMELITQKNEDLIIKNEETGEIKKMNFTVIETALNSMNQRN